MAGDIEEEWPVREIVYTAIVGAVMLAAFLEWFLWMAAFNYCLWKVFRKAEHWTVRVLAVLVGVVFTLLRSIFLPIMIVTLPLPAQIGRIWPQAMVSVLQWFAFWSFAGLLTIPWLFCIYQIVTHQLGRTKRIKQVLDEVSAPKVVIVMPCYKEDPEILVTAVNSVVDCDYPPSCIHVFLSFDGDQEDELYLNTIESLGVPLTLESYPKSIDVSYRGARITVSRFPHGGKRHCQKMTFKLIDKVYHEYLRRNDNLFILFIDSDCILDRVCLQNFVYDMELSPGNRRDMLAMTGVITSTTRKHSLITLLQDMEYIHGQLFERTVESGCGAVTCLPGALTMLRFSAFRRMAKYYFADKAEQCEDLFDFAKSHLGEDRWLTHLFMIGAKKRYQIQMCTSAFCKTEAVQTMPSLIKQRRRWFLGFITNEVCMLTDWRLWKRYPILVLVRFMQNTIRTTALLFFIMVLALMTTAKAVDDLPVGFIAISLGLNWMLMIYFGAKLRRFKIWLYPMMFVLNPFLNWYYMVYGIFTAGQRTWGGPRADAATADSHTTAQEAIEQAEKAGDDLNIVPETFIPAAQERKELADEEDEETAHMPRRRKRQQQHQHQHQQHQQPTTTTTTRFATTTFTGSPTHTRSRTVLLQPPDRVIGKFASPERTPSGWYQHPDDSAASIGYNLLSPSSSQPPPPMPPHLNANHHNTNRPGLHNHRDSFDSTFSAGNNNLSSVYMPRRVESIMGEEDRRKYELAAQASSHQAAAVVNAAASRVVWQGGGGHPPPGRVYEEGVVLGDDYLDGTCSSLGGSSVVEGSFSSPPDLLTGGGNNGNGGGRQTSSFATPLQPPPPPQPPVTHTRSGRSPLGRASWTRPVTRDEVELEMEEGTTTTTTRAEDGRGLEMGDGQGQGQRGGKQRGS
ncbi:BcCHSVII, class VII chitin synthase [Chaetomidium leptoderma]|uniref:chitin synthase n=1 Tax=Chaetomidium leptoderma TaxID=669021 RepID=A0AAN6ZZT8_9PEZI|nr:BcCHSVII, class VII chitin synthase [Chaetomidium leptoderma]